MSELPEKLGPFEVVRRLGAGGMAEVLLARDPRLGREVALKVLRKSQLDPEDAPSLLERFRKIASDIFFSRLGLAARFSCPKMASILSG